MSNTAKNIVFGLSGGWFIGAYFTFTAIIYALSIIGLKKSYGLIKCAAYCFAPFGKTAYVDFASHKFGNAFWIVTVGWQAAFICILFAVFWYLTYFGAYLGSQYYSLAQYAMSPFGAKLDGESQALFSAAAH